MTAATARQIEFDAAEHAYYLDGRRLPSVTQILKDVGIVDYSGLLDHVRDAALRRGRIVHAACAIDDEFFIGASRQPLDEDSVSDEHMGYVRAWRNFRTEQEFQPELIERASYNPKWLYAGTPDVTGRFKRSPLYKVLLDRKTGKAEPWTRYQMAAYAEFYENPRSFLRVCAELHQDATYRVYTMHGKDHAADFGVFCNALAVERAKRGMKW